MQTVTSKDGTRIAYEQSGSGQALILIDGAFGYRAFGPNGALAKLLAPHFTVYTYDRRGRGESGDASPYAVEREIEDVDALLQAAGGSAFVYGISSGAALALEAAKHGLAMQKLAVYEAPFVVDNTRPPVPDDYLARLRQMIASDRRGAAVRLFMTEGVRVPGIFVTLMRFMPAWSQMKLIAHTVVYDATIIDDRVKGQPLRRDDWRSVIVPTLIAAGSKSPAWMRNGMQALADVLPNAKHHTLEGQTHIVKAEALAPVLIAFFQA